MRDCSVCVRPRERPGWPVEPRALASAPRLLGTSIAILESHEEKIMSTTMWIVLIVVLLVMFGGGGGYYWTRSRR
jgi:hypothetical protein